MVHEFRRQHEEDPEHEERHGERRLLNVGLFVYFRYQVAARDINEPACRERQDRHRKLAERA